jgi:hypothetical protein
MRIKISSDFSFAPGPRYIREGKHSGELFRNEILRPAIEEAIRSNQKLVVDLDGTAGYGRSFLEESFGGLIRIDRMDYSSIKKVLEVVSTEQPILKEKIDTYLKSAYERQL